jgi:kynurenine formamidase
MDKLATRTGFSRLGIEKAGALITRGILIDVAALHGVEMLGDRYEITVQDLQGALKRQNMTIETADAIIINTGFGRLWGKDNVRYFRTQPGLGVGAVEWLARQNPMIVGSDTCCVEVNPNPDQNLSSPVHQILLVANGIYMIKSLKLDELVAERVHEFAFIVEPLKLRGATGSSVAPVAVR